MSFPNDKSVTRSLKKHKIDNQVQPTWNPQDTNTIKELHWETSTATSQPESFIGLGPIPVGDTHILFLRSCK